MKDFKSLVSTIREMNQRNSELRKKVHNVARPDDAAPTSDQSKLSKQAEIKTKIIDEASQDTEGDLKAPEEKKSKKPNDIHNVDAKEIKGGKTEVDINPTTDDKLEDATKETSDSKKTRKTENDKIGAKGMKEENQMFSSQKNFGLSDSLIATVREIAEKKLIGNQHKIDANHNGKIDPEDFKLLKKKKMNEGVCPKCGKNPCECSAVKEEVEIIDELSKETLRSYAQKALRKGDMAARMSNNGTKKDMSDIANKRRAGVSKAINKMAEDVEFSANEIARIEAIAKDME
jgi:hypothetical protein